MWKWLIILILPGTTLAKNIECYTHHELFHGSDRLTALYHFSLKNEVGLVRINGEISEGGVKFIFSREIVFDYKQKEELLYSVSTDVRTMPVDNVPDEILKKYHPPFFLKKGEKITFSIFPVNKDYIISFVSTPLFYCNRMK